jgi:hypothetical protein
MDLVPIKQLVRTEFFLASHSKELKLTLIVPLCKILTACSAFGYVPKAWKKVRVIFIPKPESSSSELAKSLRPISLTSFLLKKMERLSKISQFYWLLLIVLCYLWGYLIGNIWWNMPLGRYGYLKLKHGFLPMTRCLKGRILEFFFAEELDLKASFALGTLAIVFQAEVYAILACFDYCLRECMTGKTICICSDSRSALLAVSSHTVSSSLVLQCRNSLQELSIQNRIQLFWVPGHCGKIGNEEADGLVGVDGFVLPGQYTIRFRSVSLRFSF